MKVTTDDIRRRLAALSKQKPYTESRQVISSYETAIKTKNTSLVESIVRDWERLDRDPAIAMTRLLQLFDEVAENFGIGFTNKICNIICEDSIPKVRDAAQTQAYLKQKMGRFKTKLSTKINNNIEDMTNAVSNSLANMKNNANNNVNQIKQNVKNGLPGKKEEKDKAVKECYQKMYDACERYRVCDRVVENHNKISKRFNIDRIVEEYSRIDNYTAITELCAAVDTYNIPFKAKYSIALENSLYAFAKNHIPCDRKEIVNAVTDYFLFNTNESAKAKEDMKDLVSVNYFFSDMIDDDHKTNNTHADAQFDYFFNSELINKSTPIFTDKQDAEMELTSEVYGIYSFDSMALNEAFKKSNKKKGKNEVSTLINDFKANIKDKTPEQLKSLVTKIYTKPAEEIIDEAPHLLGMIRIFFVLAGSMAIHPIVGVVALIADQVIHMEFQRKETTKMIASYKKELEKTKKSLEKAKSDKDKERLEEYKKGLDRAIEKLETYEDTLYTEEENDKRKESEDDDDDDFNWESHINYVANLLTLTEESIDTVNTNANYNILDSIKSHLDEFSFDDIDAITDFAANTEYMISHGDWHDAMADEVEELRSKHGKTSEDYMRIDCMKENMYKLENQKPKTIVKRTLTDELVRFNESVEFLRTLNEMTQAMDSKDFINEASITNSLKMAGIKLKKIATGLKDKEKSMSNTIDISMSQLQKGVEKAATVDNREAVIKGSIIPPASKIIKMSITTGLAWMLNPALAVIGLLGSIAVSKKYQAKERQLVLDEIEIELQMCDKYLKIAEEKNDMKATRQLLTQQRDLQRQQQRIKYKMKVDFNQNVPDVKDPDDD